MQHGSFWQGGGPGQEGHVMQQQQQQQQQQLKELNNSKMQFKNEKLNF